MSTGPRRLKEILDRGAVRRHDRIQSTQGDEYLLDPRKRKDAGRARQRSQCDGQYSGGHARQFVVLSRVLYEMGHDPVMQMTCRDRNRLGIQSDLLGAHLLGIRNILCLTGDYPTVGDHKDAKPVYDLDSVQIMQVVQGLNNGRDLAGNKLDGSTDYMIGAASTPEADPLGPMLAKFETKVKAGAQFFQTQAIYHPEQFGSFMKAVRPFKVKVLPGVLLLRSAKMAEFMNANIPGISVPSEMIEELRQAGDKHALDVGVEIAVRTIKAIRPYCDGVHIMAIKAIDRLPEILTKAEVG